MIEMIEFLRRAIADGGSCLVFGRSGRTLAPATIAAFMIAEHDVGAAAATQLVASACGAANDADGFFAPALADELLRLERTAQSAVAAVAASAAGSVLALTTDTVRSDDAVAAALAAPSALARRVAATRGVASAPWPWLMPTRDPPPPPPMVVMAASGARAGAPEWDGGLDVSPRKGTVATSAASPIPLAQWLEDSGFPASVAAALAKANVSTVDALREATAEQLVKRGGAKLLHARRLVAQARAAL